ncbi:MAG: hypothetical protein IJJ44_00045 [Solobacterium sp.]|nr:hypothetical protein [Solobacterium sp.]
MRGMLNIILANVRSIEECTNTIRRHQEYKEICNDNILLSSNDPDIQELIRDMKGSSNSILLNARRIQKNIEKIKQILDLIYRQTEIYISECEETKTEEPEAWVGTPPRGRRRAITASADLHTEKFKGREKDIK